MYGNRARHSQYATCPSACSAPCFWMVTDLKRSGHQRGKDAVSSRMSATSKIVALSKRHGVRKLYSCAMRRRANNFGRRHAAVCRACFLERSANLRFRHLSNPVRCDRAIRRYENVQRETEQAHSYRRRPRRYRASSCSELILLRKLFDLVGGLEFVHADDHHIAFCELVCESFEMYGTSSLHG